MQKWRCTICGYVYDPAEGDMGTVSHRAHLSRKFRMDGLAPFVELNGYV